MKQFVFHLFFFIDTPPTAIYTLSLHASLPIYTEREREREREREKEREKERKREREREREREQERERERERHRESAYPVVCEKKKNQNTEL